LTATATWTWSPYFDERSRVQTGHGNNPSTFLVPVHVAVAVKVHVQVHVHDQALVSFLDTLEMRAPASERGT
jgi:hypothetical protein